MKPVESFFTELERRTQNNVENANQKVESFLYIVINYQNKLIVKKCDIETSIADVTAFINQSIK